MSYDFYGYNRPPRRSSSVVLAAVIGGIIGALLMAYIAPNYLYGTIIPWPERLSRYNYRLPDSNNGTDQPPAEPGSVTYVAETVGPAVVGIINRATVYNFFSGESKKVDRGSGSGFIIDPQGYIVTNEHVVSGAEEIVVALATGTQVKAKIIGADRWSDLAVVKIDLNDLPEDERQLPVAAMGNSSQLRVGEMVVAIGNPLGLDFARTVTAGWVSALNRTITIDERQFSLIQTDAAINQGNSGGPLCNLRGEVIGINQVKIQEYGVEGMGFAIPIDNAKPIIEQLIRYGEVVRPWLGIKGLALNPYVASYVGSDVTFGIFIAEVVPGGPADLAGIKPKDVITAVDGEKITTFAQLQRILYSKTTDDVIEVEVYRPSRKQSLTIEVKLEPMPR